MAQLCCEQGKHGQQRDGNVFSVQAYTANMIRRPIFVSFWLNLRQRNKQLTDRLPGLGEIGSYCTFTTWQSGQKLFYMKHVFFMMRANLTSLMIFNPNVGGKPEERGELSTFTCLATLWTGKHDSIKCKCVNFHNYHASITIEPECVKFSKL